MSFPIDVTPYVGIPYVEHGRSLDGCDCWGLLWMVYAALGVDVPSHRADYATYADKEQIHRLMHTGMSVWRPIEPGQERPTDGVLLKMAGEWHVGIVIGQGRMLHTANFSVGSVIDNYQSVQYKRRIVGFYRHERLLQPAV